MTKTKVSAPEAAAPTAATTPAAKTKINVQAVHGRMVHPFVPLTFDVGTLTPLTEIDSWTQSQIDAGKLQVV